MRRTAWVVIRRGEVLPFFYLRADGQPINSSQFYKPEEVTVAGPVNIEAPPPPTDMVPMGGRIIWTFEFGYIELMK